MGVSSCRMEGHDADMRGWDSAGVSGAQRANWEAYKAVVESTGPLGVIHTDAEPDGEKRSHAQHRARFWVRARPGGGQSYRRCRCSTGAAVSGTTPPLARALLTGTEIQINLSGRADSLCDSPGTQSGCRVRE